MLGGQQQCCLRIRIVVVVRFVVDLEILQTFGDGVFGVGNVDFDILVVIVAGDGERLAIHGTFLQLKLPTNDLFILGPSLMGCQRMVQRDHSDASLQQCHEVLLLLLANSLGPHVVKDNHVELVGQVWLERFRRCGIRGLLHRDVGDGVEHPVERLGLEIMPASNYQHANFCFVQLLGCGCQRED